jgi:hypothetical protein
MKRGEVMENAVTKRTLVLDDLREQSAEDLLREAVRRQETLLVRLPEGETVAIQPSQHLKPLPELEGYIPAGWKDEIYD